MWNAIIINILIPIFGDFLLNYIIPLANPRIKGVLTKILPIVEHWVEVVENQSVMDPTLRKKVAVVANVTKILEEKKITGVLPSDIDTAIQLAYQKLGLDAAHHPEETKNVG